MKFDLVLTNPPFQDTTNRGKTPHKLWIDFTRRTWGRLAHGGILCQVSPSSFRSPNSIVLDLMKQHRTLSLRFDTSKFFPAVGSTFADYAIQKLPNDGFGTSVTVSGRTMDIVLDEEVFYLPQDLSDVAIDIHRKVMFHPTSKLDVRWDYVTCHNIRLRDVDPTLARVASKKHTYKVFHTNRQIWWSSILQPWAGQKKVMWTRSGYTKPFYDPGTMGGTDMVYYVPVATDLEGFALEHNLNLALFRYIYATAKWSGFGNERVFASLPEVPRDRKLTDTEMFDMFGLDAAEVAYVRTVVG